MKILVVHNKYQIEGGEDSVVRQELSMLRTSGADVQLFEVDNDGIVGITAKLQSAMEVSYSWGMRKRIEDVLYKFSPDVMHVHNFFPRISPSVFDAAATCSCPVVQTLHNYRLLCASAQLYRDEHVCHDCIDKAFAWPAALHGCYRGSRLGSASIAAMLAINRVRGTWSHKIHRYIVLTEFARKLFAESTDIPAHRFTIKPNASSDKGCGRGNGKYALYVGRLTIEKGIGVLIEAARRGLKIPLWVAGTGPMTAEITAAHERGELNYLGRQDPAQVTALMKEASVLLIPSLWYEGLPMVIPEAFSAGLPVIASRIGSLSSLINPGINGLHFEPGKSEELNQCVDQVADNLLFRERLSAGARETYEALYRPEENARLLYSIYDQAIAESRGSLALT